MNELKSIRYTIVPNGAAATSGNGPLTYSAWGVTGEIVGLEVGSPAFGAGTGSAYIIASGTTWSQTRTVTVVKGIAQARTLYDTSVYRQVEGASASGAVNTKGGDLTYPIVDGDAIGLSTSGTYGGTGTFIIYYR